MKVEIPHTRLWENSESKVYSYDCLHQRIRSYQNHRRKVIIKIRIKINKLETKIITLQVSETKNCFFKKINKTDKLLANLTK